MADPRPTMVDESRTIQISRTKLARWTVNVRMPVAGGSHPVIVLLHGWTGDENAMQVFAPRLPQEAMLLSLRGLYPTPLGGYSWHPNNSKVWPWVDDFRPAVSALAEVLSPEYFPTSDIASSPAGGLRLLGFSQGAALAFTFALLHPERVLAVAGLSGFLPDGALGLIENRPLQGKSVFVAHGTKDSLVPVDRARQAADLLDRAGALVSYCEDDVGHKLSASCFNSLASFFSQL